MLYQKMATVTGALVLAALVSRAAWSREPWKEEAREKVAHTFSGATVLDVDDVNGSVRVIGDSGTTIRVEGERISRGIDKQALERARREVTLDTNEKNGVAQLYVNGPFRRHSEDHGFHERDSWKDYEVTYNFTIRVPRETSLKLKSVNGTSTAEGTKGRFDIESVNGTVALTDAAGYGNAKTVNGTLTLGFREAPTGPSGFKTVNGRIDATFPPGLAADMKLRTLNGEAWSDFDVTGLASPAEPGENESGKNEPGKRRNGRFVYRMNRASSVRVGAGGPALSFETVNGSITIRKGTK